MVVTFDDLFVAPSETALKIGQLDFACVDLFEQVAERFFGVIEHTDRVHSYYYWHQLFSA